MEEFRDSHPDHIERAAHKRAAQVGQCINEALDALDEVTALLERAQLYLSGTPEYAVEAFYQNIRADRDDIERTFRNSIIAYENQQERRQPRPFLPSQRHRRPR